MIGWGPGVGDCLHLNLRAASGTPMARFRRRRETGSPGVLGRGDEEKQVV